MKSCTFICSAALFAVSLTLAGCGITNYLGFMGIGHSDPGSPNLTVQRDVWVEPSNPTPGGKFVVKYQVPDWLSSPEATITLRIPDQSDGKGVVLESHKLTLPGVGMTLFQELTAPSQLGVYYVLVEMKDYQSGCKFRVTDGEPSPP